MLARDPCAAHGADSEHARAPWAARARTAIPYVTIVVALNVGFSLHPEHDAFWSLLVGSVLVLRDYAQRVWGTGASR